MIFRPVHEADLHLQPANHVVPPTSKLVTWHTDQHLFLNIAHKGFPSNCQNLQIRRAFKIVVKQLVTECIDQYRLYSLVHLLQQLVTERTDWLPAKQPCTVTSITGYCMYWPATGFTALYSSLNWLQCTGYTALYTGFNNWLQSVPAGTGYTACTLPPTTAYSMYQPATGFTALYSSLNWLASTTGYRVYRLVLTTQPCTLQQLATECTDWYWLHSLVHLLHSMGWPNIDQ